MADGVDHGIGSATATTAWETAKGGVKGGFKGGFLGAIAGAALTVSASIVSVVPALALIGIGLLAGGPLGVLAAFGVVAAVGAIAGGIVGATGGTVGGTALGLFKGAHRVASEKSQYVERGDDHKTAMAARMEYAAQQGYEVGVQKGVGIGAQLQAERMQAIAQQMGPAPQKSYTAAIDAQRAAAAATGKQI